MEQALIDILTALKVESWIAFAGFGVYFAYKLSITWVVSAYIVKGIKAIIGAIMDSCGKEGKDT